MHICACVDLCVFVLCVHVSALCAYVRACAFMCTCVCMSVHIMRLCVRACVRVCVCVCLHFVCIVCAY